MVCRNLDGAAPVESSSMVEIGCYTIWVRFVPFFSLVSSCDTVCVCVSESVHQFWSIVSHTFSGLWSSDEACGFFDVCFDFRSSDLYLVRSYQAFDRFYSLWVVWKKKKPFTVSFICVDSARCMHCRLAYYSRQSSVVS